MNYTTQHLKQFFKISHQTAKNWSKEFAAYLSPTATPGERRQRLFTDEDLSVLALVAEYMKSGKHYEDVHIALATGQRGEIPETSLELLPAPVSGQLLALRDRLEATHLEVQALQQENSEYKGMVKLLKEQLTDKEKHIRQLYKEIADLEMQIDSSDDE
jgi:DNA-binding transcriptional MerR regulator